MDLIKPIVVATINDQAKPKFNYPPLVPAQSVGHDI